MSLLWMIEFVYYTFHTRGVRGVCSAGLQSMHVSPYFTIPSDLTIIVGNSLQAILVIMIMLYHCHIFIVEGMLYTAQYKGH